MPASPIVRWKPNPGPQTRFLATTSSEVLYGGAAGGGKSAGLIAQPLRWISNPNFRALYLRREATYLGDAIDKSKAIYPALGARLVQSPRIEWVFPSGARIWFGHCEHESDVANYDSFEFYLVLFDELTHFTERQYRGIRARIRGTDPTLPRWSRAASNPGNEGHEWVFRRFAPWLDPASQVRVRSGERLWFVGDDVVPPGTRLALSREFIGAKIDDNPHLGDEYRAQLADLDPVRRAQLEDGNWLIKPAAGLYFKRAWFEIVDAAPASARRCRYWDRAGTNNPTSDWTCGARWSRTDDGTFFVEDVVRMRGTPREVESVVLQTAQMDGPGIVQVLEQDPGQAGIAEIDHYAVEVLDGFPMDRVKPTGDKITRARVASAQAQARNIKLVRGAWNKAWIEEHEAFPEGKKDQVDTSSGACAYLAKDTFGKAQKPPTIAPPSNWSETAGF